MPRCRHVVLSPALIAVSFPPRVRIEKQGVIAGRADPARPHGRVPCRRKSCIKSIEPGRVWCDGGRSQTARGPKGLS